MSATAVVTARVDQETLTLMDEIARSQGRSRGAFLAKAIKQVVASEADFLKFIDEGEAAIARRDVVPHDEVMTLLDTMVEKHQRRCAE